jgi:hypothetical protein
MPFLHAQLKTRISCACSTYPKVPTDARIHESESEEVVLVELGISLGLSRKFPCGQDRGQRGSWGIST